MIEDTEQLFAKLVKFTALQYLNELVQFSPMENYRIFFIYTILYKLGRYFSTTLCTIFGHSN